MRSSFRSIVPVVAALFGSGGAAATTIEFSEVHGRVVDLQYDNVAISAENVGGGVDIAVVYDSNLTGTRDPDLEATFGGNGLWSAGNLVGTNLGGLLIIQENDAGCEDGICNHPDDEGSRPAGSLTFAFTMPILEFGLDIIDVEGNGAEMGAIVFIGTEGTATRNFADLLDASLFGDNSANRIDPLGILGLGIGDVSTVRVEMGGSGGLDNIQYSLIPEPSTAALMGLGLLALGVCGNRRD